MREALESKPELVSISLAFDVKVGMHAFSADYIMKLSFVRLAELQYLKRIQREPFWSVQGQNLHSDVWQL